MPNIQENKRQKAYILSDDGQRKIVVIGITEQELPLVKRGKIPIERVKSTRGLLIYRRKK